MPRIHVVHVYMNMYTCTCIVVHVYNACSLSTSHVSSEMTGHQLFVWGWARGKRCLDYELTWPWLMSPSGELVEVYSNYYQPDIVVTIR